MNKYHHSAQITQRTSSSVFTPSNIKDKCSYVNRFMKLKLIKINNPNTKRSLSCTNMKRNLINYNNTNICKYNNTHRYSSFTQIKTNVKCVPL